MLHRTGVRVFVARYGAGLVRISNEPMLGVVAGTPRIDATTRFHPVYQIICRVDAKGYVDASRDVNVPERAIPPRAIR